MPFPPASSPGPGRSLAVRPSRPYPVGSVPPPSRSPPMPKVRLSYDGWLALPADVRKKLGLATGHQLELELVGGAVVLRPVGAVGPAPADPAAGQPPVEALPPEPAPVPRPPGERGPGRP